MIHYEFHELAMIFPVLSETELATLAQDIKENGLKNPITLYSGKILDGRNRYKACEIAGVEPFYTELTTGDPLKYVISLNLSRRHLNESQRAVVAEKIANMAVGGDRKTNHSPNLGNVSVAHASKLLNVSTGNISNVRAIRHAAPERISEIESGAKTIHQVQKEIKQEEKKEELKKLAERIIDINEFESVCQIKHCDFKTLLPTISPNVIITDPPYPKEYLHLYEELAILSKSVPIVAVMCGQSYLHEIFSIMTKHLKYRWTICYLTPGGQAVQQWVSKINTFWKPVILFGDSVDWIGDVARSDVNDNDKEHHNWGQSESGMLNLVNRLTKPGDLVFDPFMGAGTTGVACIRAGRKFIGCDINIEHVDKSLERCRAEFQR